MKKDDRKAMDKLLDKLLDQYYEMFHDTFPLDFLFISDEKAIEIITDCLAKRKPYKPNIPEGALL